MPAVALVAMQLLILGSRPAPDTDHLVFGLFIGSIEEGARIISPVRLLPFDHPDALNHEFPNPLVNHTAEVEALVQLGEYAGLRLRTTLQRYPALPIDEWPYPEFSPPPLDCIRHAPVERVGKRAELPGLRALIVMSGEPLVFIVDTRGLTLEERQMQRATSMGLDLTRRQFLERLSASLPGGGSTGCRALIYQGTWVLGPER
jgi:hypothetical protein